MICSGIVADGLHTVMQHLILSYPANSSQFKRGSTNFFFQQQEICLWHLSFAFVSHEDVHHTDFESSRAAVIPQVLQKCWYSGFEVEAWFHGK